MSRSVFLITFIFLLTTNALADRITSPDDPYGLAIGEARFFASQDEWFEAITRLDQELTQRSKPVTGESSSFDRLAEATRVDFEISFRLHRRGDHTLASVIEDRVDDTSRNELLLRLAKLYFQKGEPIKALETLDRVSAKVVPEIAADIAFLRAQVLMANGRYSDAIVILDALKNSKDILGFAAFSQQAQSLRGFAGFNLGLAHLLSGNKTEGHRQLDLAGQVSGQDEMVLSIRDKANLMLGEQLLKDGAYNKAGLIFDRVRLNGPFSDPTLLSAGWAAALQEKYEQALVPWTLLSERDVTETAVQEAIIAVPYCYGKLSLYSKAAPLYGRAIDVFGVEIDKLTDSISSIREGHFLKAIVRKELQPNSSWLVQLREQPDMPETYYLLDLMTSHAFQESLNNYLDLAEMQQKLTTWQQDLLAYEEMIKKRRAYYQPLLPAIDARFKKLDSRITVLLQQRDNISRQLNSMKTKPQPDLLATSRERGYLDEIDRVDRSYRPHRVIKTRYRIDRLRGLVSWPIYISYDQRLLAVNANFSRIDAVISALKEERDSFVRIRRLTTQDYSRDKTRIKVLRQRIKKTLPDVTSALARQGELLETVAETELVKRREKLEEMQVKARFAMAVSYDRAVTKRNTEGGSQ